MLLPYLFQHNACSLLVALIIDKIRSYSYCRIIYFVNVLYLRHSYRYIHAFVSYLVMWLKVSICSSFTNIPTYIILVDIVMTLNPAIHVIFFLLLHCCHHHPLSPFHIYAAPKLMHFLKILSSHQN